MLYGELSSSAIGPIFVAVTNQGVARVSFWKIDFENKMQVTTHELQAFQYLTSALTQLNLYLNGSLKNFSIPLDLFHVTPFQKQVLQVCAEIPFGQVITYKDLAISLGKPQAIRAVASALARNPVLFFIPCHRVIGSDARLHGFAAPQGIHTKAALLRLEGHTVQDDHLIIRS